ncbi:hypothetical protein SELMODRAFT_425233 [Selaginella moellendorffii]|uniref:Uncharacterized protein n=1 Tax=Selaginella moellendorffii TaxID=88036 RepID=D8SSF9_SELML|nr:hypothetical protein SELMODRAFT_425233 [Selaginella moellendorffii]
MARAEENLKLLKGMVEASTPKMRESRAVVGGAPASSVRSMDRCKVNQVGVDEGSGSSWAREDLQSTKDTLWVETQKDKVEGRLSPMWTRSLGRLAKKVWAKEEDVRSPIRLGVLEQSAGLSLVIPVDKEPVEQHQLLGNVTPRSHLGAQGAGEMATLNQEMKGGEGSRTTTPRKQGRVTRERGETSRARAETGKEDNEGSMVSPTTEPRME